MKFILALFFTLLFSACSTVELTPEGRGVTISGGKRAHRDLSEFVILGKVSSSCSSRPTRAQNLKSCQNDIRNQAADLGATLVVIEKRTIGSWLCKDCVSISGHAYRLDDYEEKERAPTALPYPPSRR